ncbi:HNH endonuclease [Campylobacter concisus]|uniref:HNH endonuclease n=1 Tax=Campylobacter concisus TaxID=199 RepID=UPI000D2F6085|nr:HNH endonuclease [Campylobacter concisus]
MKCIICRQEKSDKEFSYEHVIPESLGGCYGIETVCKNCNSYLGSKVDFLLINHFFSKIFRHEFKIPGKKGKIPNPFEGTHTIGKDEQIKTRVFFDEQGVVRTDIITDVVVEKAEDGIIKEIKILADGERSKEELDSILEKKLSRLGFKADTKNIEFAKKILNDNEIQMSIEIDLHKFKICFLKIAYEFAVDSVDDFFESENAKEISNFLLNPNFDDIDRYFVGFNIYQNALNSISKFFDATKKRHILALENNVQFGLVCHIMLEGSFATIVKLSQNLAMREPMIFGINDLEDKKFEKLNIFDLAKRTFPCMDFRFAYYFNTHKEADEFILLEKSNDFGYYMVEGEVQFFDSSFNVKYGSLDSLVNTYAYYQNIVLKPQENKNILTIYLLEELYVKILPTNKYCQILAVELSQEFKKI